MSKFKQRLKELFNSSKVNFGSGKNEKILTELNNQAFYKETNLTSLSNDSIENQITLITEGTRKKRYNNKNNTINYKTIHKDIKKPRFNYFKKREKIFWPNSSLNLIPTSNNYQQNKISYLSLDNKANSKINTISTQENDPYSNNSIYLRTSGKENEKGINKFNYTRPFVTNKKASLLKKLSLLSEFIPTNSKLWRNSHKLKQAEIESKYAKSRINNKLKRKLILMENECTVGDIKNILINRPPRILNTQLFQFNPKEFKCVSPTLRVTNSSKAKKLFKNNNTISRPIYNTSKYTIPTGKKTLNFTNSYCSNGGNYNKSKFINLINNNTNTNLKYELHTIDPDERKKEFRKIDIFNTSIKAKLNGNYSKNYIPNREKFKIFPRFIKNLEKKRIDKRYVSSSNNNTLNTLNDYSFSQFSVISQSHKKKIFNF